VRAAATAPTVGWVIAAAALLCTACARPARNDLYVVVPGQDGTAGSITVRHPGGEQVLTGPYASARITGPGRLQTGVATPEEVRQVFGAALAAQPPAPVSFLLYFAEGRDELTPEAKQSIDRIRAEIARRPAAEAVVIGHTDRVGPVPYNDALSLQRAQRVRDELVKLGIPLERIAVAGRGEREPLVATEDEVAEPRNRRVEITVR
jgi:outer membrane protein OmpA-like peptidoglycan-associated protein